MRDGGVFEGGPGAEFGVEVFDYECCRGGILFANGHFGDLYLGCSSSSSSSSSSSRNSQSEERAFFRFLKRKDGDI